MRSDVADALALEAAEENKARNEGVRQADEEIKALQHSLAARGLGHSGNGLLGELKIRFEKIVEASVKAVIAKRRELGSRVPELLTPECLGQLRDRLCRRVDAFLKAQSQQSALGTRRLRGPALNRQAEQYAYGLKATIGQEIEVLRLEGRLGIHQREEKPMTFNVSHSTIASLNLGTVMGGLTASVAVLNGQDPSHQELAKTIQVLAEALARSSELEESLRKDLLEHLSLVSDQAVRPNAERKLALVKSSLAVLKDGISTVQALASLWPSFEHVLKGLGML